MKRRQFLAYAATAVGATSTGCTQLLAVGSETATSVAVEDLTDASPYGYSFDVEVLESVSDATPARLEITLENVTDRKRELTLGSTPPFFQLYPEEPGSGIRLIPDTRHGILVESNGSEESDEFPPEDRVDGCWRLRHELARHAGAKMVSLEPRESISERYSVFTAASAVECLPTGSYRFTSDDYFESDAPCGFTLVLA